MDPNADFDQSLRDFLGPEAYEQKRREHEEALRLAQRRKAMRDRVATSLIRLALIAILATMIWQFFGPG